MHLTKIDDNTKRHHYQNFGQTHETKTMLHHHRIWIHIHIHEKCIVWEDLEHVEIKETIYIILFKTKRKNVCSAQLITLPHPSQFFPNELEIPC